MSNNIISQFNNESNLDYAMRYFQEFNLSIIPNIPEKKGPTYVSWKKYQNTRPTLDEIYDWWNKWPNAGISIITGRISGLIVLDIDPRHGGLETIRDKDIPKTWTSRTGGGGYHYFFQYPDGNNNVHNFTGDNVGLPGVDLRGDGGLIIAPPSIHTSGNRYEFVEGLEPWEIELAPPPPWLMNIINNRTSKKQSHTTDWQKVWSGVNVGNRNATCAKLAGKLAHSGASEKEAVALLKGWNKKNKDSQGNPSPLPDKEVEDTVANIYKLHESSRNKNKPVSKEKMEKLLPSELASMLLKHLRDTKKEVWIHVPEMDKFYFYSSDEGYWRIHNENYLQAEIRELLRRTNPEWERNSNINEVLAAFKHLTQDEKFNSFFVGNSQPNLHLINVSNGMLNWKTGELKPHNAKYFSLFQIPVVYDPKAKCPNWLQAMEDWIPGADTRNFLQEFAGYCLVPDTSLETALFLVGSGANGKSSFLNILVELFGKQNLTSIPLSRIGNRFETVNLQSKLANICSDIDPVYLQKTGLLKLIISGDPIRGEHKYGESYDFIPCVRLIFSANELPTTSDKTEGWYRKIKIVEFPNKFSKEDGSGIPDFKKKLMSEIPGILNWALDGLRRLRLQGHFTASKDVEAAKRKYEAENDSVASFAQETLEKVDVDEPKYVIPKAYLYSEYKLFCEENGLKGVGRRKMVSRMKKLGFEEAKRRRHFRNTGKMVEVDLPFEVSGAEKKKKPRNCFVRVKYTKED